MLCLIFVGSFALLNAQGITNTLGGNTADDKFIVENSDAEAGLVVTGEGNVGIATTAPEANLHVDGDVILGISGTRFMEILEITGITGTGTYTTYTDKLPSGWTGEKTRVLSFEIQNYNTGGAWYSAGYAATTGGDEIAYHLIHFSREMTVYYPDASRFHGRTWRAMIMRMP